VLAGLEKVIGLVDVELEGGAGSKVSGPEGMGVTRVGKKIILLHGPREACSVNFLEVAGGCRVEDVDLGSIRLTSVDVPVKYYKVVIYNQR
jgi:hypothetical protein